LDQGVDVSDTPRTDVAERIYDHRTLNDFTKPDGWEFARTLERDLAERDRALGGMVDLVETWMRGPLFAKAGVHWEGPEFHPKALRDARALLLK
jgi:hypothetical protein